MGDIKPLPSRTWHIIVITTLAAALGVAIVTVCESMLLVEWIPAAMTRLFVGVPCVLVWLGATAYALYSFRASGRTSSHPSCSSSASRRCWR